MENSRRPFDRSREPGTKKPRLTEELERGPNPSVRQFPQRQVASSGITTLASARFRANDRDLESGGYQPQPPPHQELVAQYKTALAELTFNSKPIITNLTIIAGENQYAAKAIAATVCANILEVPSEQKLPSLYLLDSIVKNIGRDYIKYFAARLPEVFCKAYRQVDPSVHTSMRHLFGTWRGVFPPQTLQMIEKELDFTPAVNGSASASAAVRSDSQSQRPPHSIHVNPKYLERQRLQQSSRPKGVVDDMTVATANSTEDPERPDRALGAAQPWVDPGVSMGIREHNQRTYKGAFNDSVLGKSLHASFGSSEYGSDLSRNLGSSIGRTGGRVTELGQDKTWYKAGSGIAETISGKRNGFSLKHGFSNNEVPKSMNSDAHHQTTQSLTSIRSSVTSSSWKNSEEEEFMWDEMNSGLTGHGAPNVSNNLSNDPWTADDENLEVEDHLQIGHPFGAKVDREISTESLSTEKKQIPAFGRHPSLSWQLQEQHSTDKLNQRPGHSDGFVSNFGGLAANTKSSATSTGNRPLLPNAKIGIVGIAGQQQFHSVGVESPSGISPLRQQSPSLPVGNLRRTQQKDLQGPFSSPTSFQQRHQQQVGSSRTEVTVKTEKPPVSKVSLAGEMSKHPSSLSGAAVKSGIFSNNPIISSLDTTSSLDKRNLQSQFGVRPARSGGPSPATLISSLSAIALPSSLGPLNEDSSTQPQIAEGKDGQPLWASTLQPASSNVSNASVQTSSAANNTLNPIENLLSSLVAKGLISAETESPTKLPAEVLTRLEDQSKSITTSSSLPVTSVSGSATVPVLSTRVEVDAAAKPSLAVSQSTSTEIKNLIGFEFKPDVIRELHPPVIRGLSDNLPHLCSICGLRLKHQEQFNRHLEWHATREREHNSLMRASRRWYAKSSDWIVGKAEYPSEYELTDSVDAYGKKTDTSQVDAMVLADENQCLCVLCGELFEDVYCQERNEWMFKGAVYMTNSDSDSEMGVRNVSTARGPIIHELCLSENMISSVPKTEQD